MSKKIVIVGGGTAGWMAANLMALEWADKGFEISLVESSEIGIIGVGEGSTPQLKAFFDIIGVDEAEWMPECNATYKAGIRFCNWSAKPGFENYFHPFPAKTDNFSAPAFLHNSFMRRGGADIYAHPDKFFLATYLAENHLGPKPEYNFPLNVSYGYHFDSSLVGIFLRKKATARNVKHIDAKIENVVLDEKGYISHLLIAGNKRIEADFFVDCSGFTGLLIQKALNVPFISFAENLFNDSAVVMPTPHTADYAPQTTSTALKNGWMWNIPLTNRIGNGYVYSSSFCSADDAEKELRAAVGMLESDTPVRHIKMKVGRVEKHWFKNCVAVGLSQGFIEPLEATALHLVQDTVQNFIKAFDDGDFTEKNQQVFNDKINRRFEGIRNYIVCHYRMNSRQDTDYWIENSRNNNLSESLRAVMHVWFTVGDLGQELTRQKIEDYYPLVSWSCLLAGYGIFPDPAKLKPIPPSLDKYKLSDVEDFIRRCGLNFKEHKVQLDMLR